MKTLMKIGVIIALIACSRCLVTAATPVSKPERTNINLSTSDFALMHYVAVTTAGESRGVDELFTMDFIQTIQGADARYYGRNAVVNHLKVQRGEKLNCKVTTRIVEKSTDYIIAKITLKFNNFNMVDLVTIVYDDGAWKVCKSIHSFQ